MQRIAGTVSLLRSSYLMRRYAGDVQYPFVGHGPHGVMWREKHPSEGCLERVQARRRTTNAAPICDHMRREVRPGRPPTRGIFATSDEFSLNPSLFGRNEGIAAALTWRRTTSNLRIEMSMEHAQEYRIRALEFLELAHGVSEPAFRTQLINLAMSYARLADLAERNDRTDVSYETPPATQPARH